MDQGLWVAQWELHTKLSTECVGKYGRRTGHCLDEKLCVGKESFTNQGLTSLSICLHTVLSTEGVQKHGRSADLGEAYPLPLFER